MSQWAGHAGQLVTAVAGKHGVKTMFTLSGAHVFPAYDGVVHPLEGTDALRILDVRHEQTAAFAAEATGKLTRTPGFAVLTAGPGVTNGLSAMAQAKFGGSPMVVLGGRSPSNQWGKGALQELDHLPIVGPVTKHAQTLHTADEVLDGVTRAFGEAGSAHRGPAYFDIPFDVIFQSAAGPVPQPTSEDRAVSTEQLSDIIELFAQAQRPVLVLGTDVWIDSADGAARAFVEAQQIPTITTGMARGVLPAGHPLLVGMARRQAFTEADVVVVAGTPLDFRLGYGAFGPPEGPAPQVVHLADSEGQLARHVALAGSAHGSLASIFATLTAALDHRQVPDRTAWIEALQSSVVAARGLDAALLGSDASPIHPARIFGELIPRLADDAVVIGDGGDFVSFAGRFLEPQSPGCWLDPGPYGCLGAGLGAAIAARIARPSSQVVLLLGDGAAGFSLMDVDTLVRHNLPVVMVMGNNSAWGLEKGPMQLLYGYDVAADLAPQTRYDAVVRALGGAGEIVTEPAGIGPALDRAFASGVPYLVNVITDVNAAYPRNTLGV